MVTSLKGAVLRLTESKGCGVLHQETAPDDLAPSSRNCSIRQHGSNDRRGTPNGRFAIDSRLGVYGRFADTLAELAAAPRPPRGPSA